MNKVTYDNWEHGRRVFYSEFEACVSKYSTPGLLAALAETSASMTEFSGFQQNWATLAPWTISGIARQAIISSNRSKGLPFDSQGYRRAANLFGQIEVNPVGKFEAYPFLAGKAHEQFPFQLSAKEDLTRTLAVLLDTPVEFTGHKTKADFDDLVGTPIEDLANSTFMLYGLAKAARGVITRGAIEAIVNETADKLPSFDSLWATLNRLSASVEEARADALGAPQFKNGLQKFGYNPLIRTPFIRLNDDLFLAPQTYYILRSCSLENIYYAGMKRWPKQFGFDLGRRVEAYTGRQLKQTGNLEIHPEIPWRGNLSIDWFVITPAATILIECKSAHPTLDSRVGAATGAQSAANKLLPAYTQIQKTVAELKNSNDAFAHIPKDKPLVALIVTAEPIYLANFEEVREYLPDTDIPILTLCLRDLESLATLPPDVLGETLLKIGSDPELSRMDMYLSVKQVIGNYRLDLRNELIDTAYLKYVMPDHLVTPANESPS